MSSGACLLFAGKLPTAKQIKTVFYWISRQKCRGFMPRDFAQTGDPLAYAKYLALLKESNAVDFDGLLTHVRDLMASNPTVKQTLQRRHAYLLVDEYQDSR